MKRLLIAALATATLASPALADFFIVREGNAGQCRIVETRPTDTKIIVVGTSGSPVRVIMSVEDSCHCYTSLSKTVTEASPPSGRHLPTSCLVRRTTC